MSHEYSKPFIINPQSKWKIPLATKFGGNGQNANAAWRNASQFVHIGQSGYSATGCSIVVQSFGSGSGVTAANGWLEVGIFKGFFPLTLTSSFSPTGPFEDLPTLTRLGVANFGTVIGTTSGTKVIECSFTGATCFPEDELWFALGVSATTVPTLGIGSFDRVVSGRWLAATGSALGRLSGLTSVGPGTLIWGPTASTSYPPFPVGVLLYG